MNIPSFFRFLNRKIEKYDKMASNPFEIPQKIVLIWIEDCIDEQNYNENNYN